MIFLRPRNSRHYPEFTRPGSSVSRAIVFAIAAMLLSGCEVVDRIRTDIQAAVSAHPLMKPSPAQTALTEGIGMYERGEFNGAIKRLSSSADIWSADYTTQTKALKYIAFSYCVTSRQALCRQHFEKALKLDPDFDLQPGEKGHPLWGKTFQAAKRSK